MRYQLRINEKNYTVDVGEIESGSVQVAVNGREYEVRLDSQAGSQTRSTSPDVPERFPSLPPESFLKTAESVAGEVIAPIPGLIMEIKVSPGERVRVGQVVATMEAMKMENNLSAPISGLVQEIRVQKGAEVSTGDIIMRIG